MAYVWLGCTELELNNGDFSLLHTCRSTSSHNNVLVEDNTIYKLGIFYSPSHFLHYPDVAQIYR